MNTENGEKQNITVLAPIPSEPPEADQKLRHLTDDEIIQGLSINVRYRPSAETV